MPSGTRGRGNPEYSSTEYAQPWPGIDVSKPSSQIAPGSAISANAMNIRGGVTLQPAWTPPIGSAVPIVTPSPFGLNPSANEAILLIANLGGFTFVVTNFGIFSDWSATTATSKTFASIYTFPLPAYTQTARFGSIVIGNTLYISSNKKRGVYAIVLTTLDTPPSVSEITAKNGSQPFIGGAFLFSLAGRLCLWDIIGGDGNQTGSVTGATVTTGGTGYPASGSVLFTGGGGQSATGTFTATGGVITAITITNGGSGFLSAPTPSIVGTTGTGFTGTATISGFTSNSTDTNYPDYVAWSFPGSYGSFDPNSTLLGGGFDQLTEARGLGTGVAVFEAVGFLAHNGGFTEMVPNTSSSVGSNIEPFTFAPLWSADQGVVCRYGSMAQYGAMCCFLGYDQPYQLTPNGVTPIGDSVATLLQNYSLWQNGGSGNIGDQLFLGIFGSIVEIDGEKHYLIGFTSDQPLPRASSNTRRQIQIYDSNLKTGSWHIWNYLGITLTCAIYQSYDIQAMPTDVNFNVGIARDTLILAGITTSGATDDICNLAEIMAGSMLYALPNSTLRYGSENFSYLFRSETPSMAIPQTSRRLLIEYENIPNLSATPTILNCTLYGQPLLPGNGSSDQTPIANTFTVSLPYYASGANVPQNAVLTALSAPIGTAHTALATSLSLSTASPIRLIRAALIAETTQGDLQ